MSRKSNRVPFWAVALCSWVLSAAYGIDTPQPAASPAPSSDVAALVAKGRMLRNSGDLMGGKAAFEDALAKARSLKDLSGEAAALNNLASVYRYDAGLDKITANQNPPLDLIDKATTHYEQALRAAGQAGNKTDEAYATLYLGVLAAGRGSPDKAFPYYVDALEKYKKLQDTYYQARTLMFMGATTLYHRHQPEASLKYFEQALPMFREVSYWHEAQWVINEMQVAYTQLRAQPKDAR
jgi:tetratricopeptide (TPR) repeat protein